MLEQLSAEIINKARQIKLAVFDVDGVLTDGSLLLGDNGSEYKVFYAQDGLGLSLLQQSPCEIAIISGRSSTAVYERLIELGIKHIYQNIKDKGKTLDLLLSKLNIKGMATAYIGDDLIDLPAMRRVGLAIAVANAHPLVIKQSHWTSKKQGGQGAVREICELILHAQGTFDAQIKHFLDN